MLNVETTANCPRVPVLLYGLEELGADYALRLRPNGYFNETYGTIGPALIEGDLVVLRLDAALRHAARRVGRLLPAEPADLARAESWMEMLSTSLRPAIVRCLRARSEGEKDKDAEETFAGCLSLLETELEGKAYLLGEELTIADLPYIAVRRLPLVAPNLGNYPNAAAYFERLLARDAFKRAQERLTALEKAGLDPV